MNELMGQYGQYGKTALIIVGYIAIIYLLFVRPRKKQQQKQKEMNDSLKEGVEVITTSGIKGTIVAVRDEFVEVRVDKGVKLTFLRSAVSRILN